MIFETRLRIREACFNPGQIRREAIAIELLLQTKTVDIQDLGRGAIQFDELIKDRISEGICVGRIRFCDS